MASFSSASRPKTPPGPPVVPANPDRRPREASDKARPPPGAESADETPRPFATAKTRAAGPKLAPETVSAGSLEYQKEQARSQKKPPPGADACDLATRRGRRGKVTFPARLCFPRAIPSGRKLGPCGPCLEQNYFFRLCTWNTFSGLSARAANKKGPREAFPEQN